MEDQDIFKEVTTESWGSRIIGSIKSVLFGIVLFLAAFVVLWLNEGRAVKTSKGLTEGASVVISVNSEEVDQSNSGKLVHLTGKVTTEESLKDEEFQIDVNALKLRRNVLMYQWVEKTEQKKEKQVGGSEKTTTVYNYEKVWKSSIINSADFKIKEGHNNPAGFPYAAYTNAVSTATIGNFKMTNSLLSSMNDFVSYSLSSVDTLKHKNAKIINEASASLTSGASLSQAVFIGKGSNTSPEVGDVKISFDIIKSGEDYSIISKQIDNTFEAYKTETGTSIQLISKGNNSAEQMFESAQKRNTIITWILRLVGFLMMFGGLSLVVKPLVVLADVLPILGSIVDLGLSVFTGLISFGLSFITIAIAWIVYRPVLGISLLVIGLASAIFVFTRKSKKDTGE